MSSPPGQAGTPRTPAPYVVRFSAGDLRQVRRAVAAWAEQAGLPGQRAADFVIAVHEIAANAVVHGSPVARLDLHIDGEAAALAEVCDRGHWPPEPPAATAPAGLGMGLQVARRVCDDVTICRGASGTTVTLRMSLPG